MVLITRLVNLDFARVLHAATLCNPVQTTAAFLLGDVVDFWIADLAQTLLQLVAPFLMLRAIPFVFAPVVSVGGIAVCLSALGQMYDSPEKSPAVLLPLQVGPSSLALYR